MIPLLLLGSLGLGAAAMFARRSAPSTAVDADAEPLEKAQPSLAWVDRVIERVALHEGRYDSVNRNTDGAGLSFGMLQWAQKPGSLGVLLHQMYSQEPEVFAEVFGSQWRDLLAATASAGVRSVGGIQLWREPWVGRFIRAGRTPELMAVQRRLARDGEHFQGALAVARKMGIATERSVALFFDTSVQQGPRAAMRIAEQVLDEARKSGQSRIGYKALLEKYAHRAPARYRRRTAPTKPFPSSHIEWRKVGAEWHAWAGRFNLFTNILKRRLGIIADEALEDVIVRLPESKSA